MRENGVCENMSDDAVNIDDGGNGDGKGLVVNDDGSACEQTYPDGVCQDDQINNDDDQSNIIQLPNNDKMAMQALSQNEDGDACLVVAKYRMKYCFDCLSEEWFYWNDNYWRKDKLSHHMRLIDSIIDRYSAQLHYELLAAKKACTESNQKKETTHKANAKLLSERIYKLSTLTRKQSVMKLSRLGVDSLGITGEEWSKNPYLIACKNGVIDLQKGEFRPGQPDDWIKIPAPTPWTDINAECPIWEQFLLSTFGGDQEVVSYMRRLLGYSIAGLTTEHIYPILWGPKGRNGKGTMFETLKYVLGDLVYKAPRGFLLQTKNHSDGSAPNAAVMALRGTRIVWCSETNEGDRLDIGNLKELTGGDTISTRLPYAKEQTQFKATHTLFTITNSRPRILEDDQAFWARAHMIPFEYSFVTFPDPKNPRQVKADPDLPEKLKAEASGILAWLVRGHMEWAEFGLLPPQKVFDATAAYRANEDVIGHFISECCVTGDSDLRAKTIDMYRAYKNWCDDVGHKPRSKTRFMEDMRGRFETVKNSTLYFVGIGILD